MGMMMGGSVGGALYDALGTTSWQFMKISDSKPDISSWSFLAFNPLPDGPLASPLTENGPRSDWT